MRNYNEEVKYKNNREIDWNEYLECHKYHVGKRILMCLYRNYFYEYKWYSDKYKNIVVFRCAIVYCDEWE